MARDQVDVRFSPHPESGHYRSANKCSLCAKNRSHAACQGTSTILPPSPPASAGVDIACGRERQTVDNDGMDGAIAK